MMYTYRTYKTEFPDFGEMDVALPEGFEDTSWHNDVCPSFAAELPNNKSLIVFIDYADKALREIEGCRFFCGVYNERQNPVEELESDDWAEITAWLAAHKGGAA